MQNMTKKHFQYFFQQANELEFKDVICVLRGLVFSEKNSQLFFNPLMTTAAKISLTILMKSFKQKHHAENILRGNVNEDKTENSPNIL